jgi:lipoprotein signal peptidase
MANVAIWFDRAGRHCDIVSLVEALAAQTMVDVDSTCFHYWRCSGESLGSNLPVFNVADAAICVGAFMLALEALFNRK